jgi:hypothetical protein
MPPDQKVSEISSLLRGEMIRQNMNNEYIVKYHLKYTILNSNRQKTVDASGHYYITMQSLKLPWYMKELSHDFWLY